MATHPSEASCGHGEHGAPSDTEASNLDHETLLNLLKRRYAPSPLTPDSLPSIVEKSFQLARKMHVRPIICMPTPNTADAPETFHGKSGKALPIFFERFERCLADAEVEDEAAILSHLLNYVGPSVSEWIQDQETFQRDDYVGLKTSLLTLFGNPKKLDSHSPQDLAALVITHAKSEATSPDELSERRMVFETMSNKLVAAGKLQESDRDELYFKSFPMAKREAIWNHLLKADPWHPRGEAFPWKTVFRAAVHLLESRFDADVVRDPKPTVRKVLEKVPEPRVNMLTPGEDESYAFVSDTPTPARGQPGWAAHRLRSSSSSPRVATIPTLPDASTTPLKYTRRTSRTLARKVKSTRHARSKHSQDPYKDRRAAAPKSRVLRAEGHLQPEYAHSAGSNFAIPAVDDDREPPPSACPRCSPLKRTGGSSARTAISAVNDG